MEAPMRLLVTGAGGMLGRDVTAAAERAGLAVTPLSRAELDITDAAAVRAAIARARASAVINCAAWTDVDGAEANEDAATAVNGAGAANVVAAANQAGAFVVHVSSDYVFDGTARQPYTADAPTNPLSAYGRSKLAGERAIAGSGATVRSSWLFGAHGRNFVDTMLRLGREREQVTVVDDQIGCPTYTGHLAEALVQVAVERRRGVLHVAGGGSCSWHDLAVAAFREAGVDCEVVRGKTVDLERPAPRPAYSVLRSDIELPHWRDGLRAYLTARVAA
jgi:dTDP-4-dehydrorhamnose reductase